MSRVKFWNKFTKKLINYITDNSENIIFILQGGNAKNIKKYIQENNKSKHYYLECNHPSPLSANRGGWFGNKHFSRTNEILKKLNKQEING